MAEPIDCGIRNADFGLKTLGAINADDLHLLPRNMQELAGVVGIPALLAIVQYYAGIHLYVPHKVDANSELGILIGSDALEKLVARYAGDSIEIAFCIKACRIILHRQVREDLVAGMSKVQIARKYRYTVRNIWNIEMRGEPEAERNGSLF